jgi:hypothetical protein
MTFTQRYMNNDLLPDRRAFGWCGGRNILGGWGIAGTNS